MIIEPNSPHVFFDQFGPPYYFSSPLYLGRQTSWIETPLPSISVFLYILIRVEERKGIKPSKGNRSARLRVEERKGSNQAKAIGAHDSGKSRSWRCELGPNTLHSPLCASG
uniref:Uncharacterized protein n=1 Tax=Helianthus annuus TaxID=4232 RepID=A0A251TSB9_HELAN